MIILSGLGNPGREYEGTRHNLGFDLINFLHKHYNFPEFKKKPNAVLKPNRTKHSFLKFKLCRLF